MAKIYNFFDAFERDLAIAEKEYEVHNRQVCLMELANAAGLEINRARSELRVMAESGEVSDLLYLVEAAEKESVSNQEGIFAKAAHAVGNFFVKIANAIQKLFTGKNMDAYNKRFAKVPVGLDKLVDGIDSTLGKIEAATNTGGGVLKKVAAGVAALGGVITGAGGVMAMYDTVKKNSKAKNLVNRPMKDISGMLTKMEALLLKCGNQLSKLPGKVKDKITGNGTGGDSTTTNESWLGMPFGELFMEADASGNGNTSASSTAATQNNKTQASDSGQKPGAASDKNTSGSGNTTPANGSSGEKDDEEGGGFLSTAKDLLSKLRGVISAVVNILKKFLFGSPDQFNDGGNNSGGGGGSDDKTNGAQGNNNDGGDGSEGEGKTESATLAESDDFDPIAAMMANLEV